MATNNPDFCPFSDVGAHEWVMTQLQSPSPYELCKRCGAQRAVTLIVCEPTWGGA